MATTHIVKAGESLSGIAAQYGFGAWQTIYDHENNSALKARKPDPADLTPGDQLFIPDKRPKTVVCETGRVHTFTLKGLTRPAALSLYHHDDPPLPPDATEFPRLETNRLYLRGLLERDAQDFFEVYANAEVARYLVRPVFTSVAEANTLIATVGEGYREGRSIDWGLVFKETGQVIGRCRFYDWLRARARAEVGYALARSYWGQGLMREALTAVLAYGFVEMNLRIITAHTYPGNTRSVRLLESLGFVQQKNDQENLIADEGAGMFSMYLLER